jgi:hypothetical protein
MTSDNHPPKDRPPASNNEEFVFPTGGWPTTPTITEPSDRIGVYGLRGIGGLFGALLGSDIARSLVGSGSWRDEAVALFLGMAGVGIANQFILRLCSDRPKLSSGVRSAAATGGGLGLGWLALGAAGVSLIDGGILLASILVPAGARALANSRGGTKLCPYCNKKQSCSHAVCRHCLNMFFPAAVPDCAKNFFLDWYSAVSFLQAQGLNYFEARDFFKAHYTQEVKNGRVGCAEFLKWAQSHRKEISDHQRKIDTSEKACAELDRLGL